MTRPRLRCRFNDAIMEKLGIEAPPEEEDEEAGQKEEEVNGNGLPLARSSDERRVFVTRSDKNPN